MKTYTVVYTREAGWQFHVGALTFPVPDGLASKQAVHDEATKKLQEKHPHQRITLLASFEGEPLWTADDK
jgi:hypothetical protein